MSYLKVVGASELILHLHYISKTETTLEQHEPQVGICCFLKFIILSF